MSETPSIGAAFPTAPSRLSRPFKAARMQWEYVMEYSKDINALLGNPKSNDSSLIEDPKEVLKKFEEPTSTLKAAWELMEMFYVDKLCQSWLPERLVDWLADYDSLLSGDQLTVHSKLVEFQGKLVTLQVIEDDPKYWEVILSALAVGWLEIVVKHLLLHGSHQLDQLGYREENVSQTNILLNKLQELSMASVRPGFVTADLPADALNSVRLALATTLGRAILEEQ